MRPKYQCTFVAVQIVVICFDCVEQYIQATSTQRYNIFFHSNVLIPAAFAVPSGAGVHNCLLSCAATSQLCTHKMQSGKATTENTVHMPVPHTHMIQLIYLFFGEAAQWHTFRSFLNCMKRTLCLSTLYIILYNSVCVSVLIYCHL